MDLIPSKAKLNHLNEIDSDHDRCRYQIFFFEKGLKAVQCIKSAKPPTPNENNSKLPFSFRCLSFSITSSYQMRDQREDDGTHSQCHFNISFRVILFPFLFVFLFLKFNFYVRRFLQQPKNKIPKEEISILIFFFQWRKRALHSS